MRKFLAGSLFALALGFASQAQAAGETNTLEMTARKSVFQDDFKSGKDPFFPRSTRRSPKAPVLSDDRPVAMNFVLKGITGPPKKRFALINNQTLSAGETAMVRVGNSQVRVQCLEIREDVVLISVEGNSEHQELRMRGN